MLLAAPAPSALLVAGLVTAAAALGMVFGSFLTTLGLRWLRGGSALTGRSSCDACHAVLRWFELVPLVSAAAQRGRCRQCGAAIDRRHGLGELYAGAAGALAAALWLAGHWPGGAALAFPVLALLLLPLILTDCARRWLPDPLVAVVAVAGLLLGGLLGIGLVDRLIGLMAGWAVLAAVAALFLQLRGHAGLGGGDAKLMGALGAWLGWQALPWLIAGSALAGLIWLAVVTARRGRAPRTIPLGAMMPIPALLLAALAAGG